MPIGGGAAQGLSDGIRNGIGLAGQIQSIQQSRRNSELQEEALKLQQENELREQKLKLDQLKLKADQRKKSEEFFAMVAEKGGAPLQAGAQGPPTPEFKQDPAKLFQAAGNAGQLDAFKLGAQQGIIKTPTGQVVQQGQRAQAELTQANADNLRKAQEVKLDLQGVFKTMAEKAPEGSTERDRFGAASVGVLGISGGDLAGFINQQFPNVKDAANPFQALVGEGNSARQAMSIISAMDVQNKLAIAHGKPAPERPAPALMEALSMAEHDKQFGELTQDQRKGIINEYNASAGRRFEAGEDVKPLPNTTQKEIIDLKKVVLNIDNVLGTAKDEHFGKMNFVGNKVKLFTGTADPGLTATHALMENLKANVINALSGTAASEGEVKRIESFVGTVFDEPTVVKQKLITLKGMLEGVGKATVETALKTKGEFRAEQAAKKALDAGEKVKAQIIMRFKDQSDDDLQKELDALLKGGN